MKKYGFGNFNFLEDAVNTTGGAAGGAIAVAAGTGLLKRKLNRDYKYDNYSSDLDYQSNLKEANKIENPAIRNATITKLQKEYDDRKEYLVDRKGVGNVAGRIGLGVGGAAAGYGITNALTDFSHANFNNPIHGTIAKVAAASGVLSGMQNADKKYWSGRQEIENIQDPNERTAMLRDYDSFDSKLKRFGNTAKDSAIQAGIRGAAGYAGSRVVGKVFGARPPQQQQVVTNP